LAPGERSRFNSRFSARQSLQFAAYHASHAPRTSVSGGAASFPATWAAILSKREGAKKEGNPHTATANAWKSFFATAGAPAKSSCSACRSLACASTSASGSFAGV